MYSRSLLSVQASRPAATCCFCFPFRQAARTDNSLVRIIGAGVQQIDKHAGYATGKRAFLRISNVLIWVV